MSRLSPRRRGGTYSIPNSDAADWAQSPQARGNLWDNLPRCSVITPRMPRAFHWMNPTRSSFGSLGAHSNRARDLETVFKELRAPGPEAA